MAVITCKNLEVGYDGKSISMPINMSIESGDYVCIVGENGAGKSTLVKTFFNLIPAVKGEIILGDGLSRYDIGFLPQKTPVQKDFPASVWEVVLSGTMGKLGSRPFYTESHRQLALENMEKMDIAKLGKKSFRTLSGGQQQRVLLARALCAATQVLLLDEPVTGLDPAATSQLYELIKNLNNNGMTIIMITHDINAIKYASHVLHVSKEQSFFGTKEEYLTSGKMMTLGSEMEA